MQQSVASSSSVGKKMIDIGLTIGQTNAAVYVRQIRNGSAAAQAGILPGDELRELNGLTILNRYTTDVLLQMLNGPEGSSVKLEIGRQKDGGILDIILVRRPDLVEKPFDLDMRGNVMLLRIRSYKTAPNEIRIALQAVDWTKVQGLIIDVRPNPTAVLSKLDELLGSILPSSTDYGILNYKTWTKKLTAMQGPVVPLDKPIVLVTNEGWNVDSLLLMYALQKKRDAVLLYEKGTLGKNESPMPGDLGDTQDDPIQYICADQPDLLFSSILKSRIGITAGANGDTVLDKAIALITKAQ